MSIASRPRAGFTRMIDGTAEEWAIIEKESAEHARGLPSRLLAHLKLLMGQDKNMRDKYKDHEYYDDCEEFCRKYDQNSFDPTYSSMPLVDFEPVIQRIFTEPKQSIYRVEQ